LRVQRDETGQQQGSSHDPRENPSPAHTCVSGGIDTARIDFADASPMTESERRT
jgi:hypothetical protein